jgi:RHS repeat-associated protein
MAVSAIQIAAAPAEADEAAPKTAAHWAVRDDNGPVSSGRVVDTSEGPSARKAPARAAHPTTAADYDRLPDSKREEDSVDDPDAVTEPDNGSGQIDEADPDQQAGATAPKAVAKGAEPSLTANSLPTASSTGVTGKTISVPKGEGTVKGMEESFSTQLSTGVATFAVPISLLPARGRAQPSLGLSYSSASGLGEAGMGWSIGVPFIARQTDRGIPRYNEDPAGAFSANQDRYVFNGGQELVPICVVGSDLSCAGALTGGTNPEEMPPWAAGHMYFRPRVEGSFLRFFRDPKGLTWRVQSKDGITMELGVPLDGKNDRSALEVDPDDPSRIYRWNLVRQYDPYGDTQAASVVKPLNVIVYRYAQDGGKTYLSDIYDTPPVDIQANPDVPLSTYAHHTRLKYEARPDRTASYRSGFRIEANQRLVGIDVTSKSFLASASRGLVRRYHLTYDDRFHVSYLVSVQAEGRCGESTLTPPAEDAGTESLPEQTNCSVLPPIRLTYTHVEGSTGGSVASPAIQGFEAFNEQVHAVASSPPDAIDSVETALQDVDGDGVSDVLVTAPALFGGHHYGVFFNDTDGTTVSFRQALMPVQGVLGAAAGDIRLSNFNVVPLDIDGDGVSDLVHMPQVKTYAVYSAVEEGKGFVWRGRTVGTPDGLSPRIDFGKDAQNIKVVDVNFDGLVDVVRSTGTSLETYLSLGRYPGGDGRFGTARLTSSTTADLSTEPISTCLPHSGTAISFSDKSVHLADMNGDGIVDIVRLDRGRIRYWPGRGDGYWGIGPRQSCPANTSGHDRHIEMAASPYYSDLQGDSLLLEDVNGDGLSDLVQVNTNELLIWLNVNGESWTEQHIIGGTPKSPSYAHRVRLADINGSGTLDVMWGDGSDNRGAGFRYIDLSGGTRPGLLARIENGLGRSTDLEYTTSTAERAAARGSRPWKTRMPTIVHMVKRVTVSDNLTLAGRPPTQDVTTYSYADPIYDGQQREFRGFELASSRRAGDANSPAELTDTSFLLGKCFDEDAADNVDACAVSERWRDNPHEALKGLPVMTEVRNDAGVYLLTTVNRYRLRELYVGLDGRTVRHAFAMSPYLRRYDTGAFVPSSVVDSARAIVVGSRRADNPVHNYAAEVEQTVLTLGFPRRGLNAVDQESTNYVDFNGNAIYSKEFASTEEQALPSYAETLLSGNTKQIHPAGDVTKWQFMPFDTYVSGLNHSNNGWKDATFDYDSRGTPIRTTTRFLGTIPLVRDVPNSASPPEQSPGTGTAGWVNVITRNGTLDGFGNVIKEAGPVGRCSGIIYDSLYAQFPVTEKMFKGGCDADPLTTTAIYDRGLGVPTEVSFEGKRTRMEYDAFGRLVRLFKSHPTAPDTTQSLPSVEIDYTLPPDASVHHSVVHTKTQDGANPLTDAQYLESWAYVDGSGRTFVTLHEAEPASGGPSRAIASGFTETDNKGAVRRKFVDFFVTDPPGSFDFAKTPNSPYGSQRYDAFGRQFQTFDVDGTVTLKTVYHASSRDLWDAADLEPGPHQGTYVTERLDGHGRVFETVERFHLDGNVERRITRTQYTPFGAPEVIRRIRGSNNVETTRYLVYDRQERLVLNVEPNSSPGYVLEPNPNLSHALNITKYANVVGWRYAYNDAGDLVGMSDPRGCGVNYFYDKLGRLTVEDYFPCEPHHAPYSAPTFSGSTPVSGVEAAYAYDSPVAASALPSGFSYTNTAFLKGQLVFSQDQGAARAVDYDGRGRVTKEAVALARPGAVANALADRFTDRWYQRQFTYDAMDRPVRETTGASVAELMGVNGATPESAVTCVYNQRGAVQSVSSSYGSLVASIDRTADALINEIKYGDAASTTTSFAYDFRRRLHSVQTYRGPPASAWPPNWSSSPPETFQLLLQDEDYGYDVVGNPTEIHDYRMPEEWPAGAKPVSRKAEYDDLYRVVGITYQSETGAPDSWTAPFASENAAYEANQSNPEIDPRRAMPAPQVDFDSRVRSQSFRYDWLGNTERTTDDARGFYDRSLGTIQNGTVAAGPYQLKRAEVPSAPGSSNARTGELAARYDDSGNLIRLDVDRNGPCIPTGAQCSHVFLYEWDELNRLSRARRYDRANLDADAPPDVSADTAKVELSYRYDADGNRVIKTAKDPSNGAERHTLYVFDSLELRRAQYAASFGDGTDPDYELSRTTEVPFLTESGIRLGRVVWEPTIDSGIGNGDQSLRGNQRVFMPLADYLGSASIVLDKATSELVERTTYEGYAATDSDYRPERWEGFREDYRFTGKEEDVEVGLQYFGKRFYAPLLQRWVSADPLALHEATQADLNMYAYVKGQALRSIDPVGLLENDGTGGASGTSSTGVGGEHGTAGSEVQQSQGRTPDDGSTGDMVEDAAAAEVGAAVCEAAPEACVIAVPGDNPKPQEELGDTFIQRSLGAGITSVAAKKGAGPVISAAGKAGSAIQKAVPSLSSQLDDLLATIRSGLSVGDDVADAGADAFQQGVKEALEGMPPRFNSSDVPRIFWSGGEGAKGAAGRFADATGRTTLEMTRAGRSLESAGLPWSEAKPLWETASRDFAAGAEHRADVFMARPPRADSIWSAIEKPILKKNGVEIRFHLAVVPGE